MANYSHLSYEERISIEDGLNNNKSIYQISKELGRSHSTLLREMARKFFIILEIGLLTKNM